VTYRRTSSRVKRASSRRGIFGAPRTRRSALRAQTPPTRSPRHGAPSPPPCTSRHGTRKRPRQTTRRLEWKPASLCPIGVDTNPNPDKLALRAGAQGHASSVLCSTTTHPSRRRSASMLNERRSRRRDPLQSAGPADVVGHVVGQGLRLVGAGATQRVRYVSTKGSQLLRGVLRQPQFGRPPAYGSDLTELAGIARTR